LELVNIKQQRPALAIMSGKILNRFFVIFAVVLMTAGVNSISDYQPIIIIKQFEIV
jgi:hypothetical protein